MMRAATILVLVFALAACGMKGDLSLPEALDESTTTSAPVPADGDQGERRTIPATPDPSLSR
jgi:predicted small lipoprotein YifL